MAHEHSPVDHVVDEVGSWTFTTDLFGGLHVTLLDLRPYGIPFTLTKFMLLELIAAVLILVIFIPLARRAAKGGPPTGPWWNAFESLLTFIRDQVAKPSSAATPSTTTTPTPPKRRTVKPPTATPPRTGTNTTSTSRFCGRCSCSSCS
jgi:hypothetical protein